MYGISPNELARIPADTLEAHWFLFNEVRTIEKAVRDKNKKSKNKNAQPVDMSKVQTFS